MQVYVLAQDFPIRRVALGIVSCPPPRHHHHRTALVAFSPLKHLLYPATMDQPYRNCGTSPYTYP